MYSVNFLSKAKQSKAKQSKAKRELRALANNHFKTFLITLLSLTLLFSISCSNEGTTGGGDDYDYFYVSQDYNNRTNDITVIIEGTAKRVGSAGHIGFTANGSTISTISKESVANNSGSSLALEPSDFEYSESTKELTLSYTGLDKFQKASDSLTAKQKYQYTITFKFTDYSGKETTTDVTVNLIKAQLITKDDILTMMKNIKCSDNELFFPASAGEIVLNDGSGGNAGLGSLKFSFASLNANQFNTSSIPNFTLQGTSSHSALKTFKTGSVSRLIAQSIYQTTQYKEWFSGYWSGIDYNTVPTINNKNATFTLKFTSGLKSGYALSSQISSVLTSGLTIRLVADDKSAWD